MTKQILYIHSIKIYTFKQLDNYLYAILQTTDFWCPKYHLQHSYLCNAYKVPPLEGDGPALPLDGCGLLISLSADLCHNIVREVVVAKILDGVGDISSSKGDLLLGSVNRHMVNGKKLHPIA